MTNISYRDIPFFYGEHDTSKLAKLAYDALPPSSQESLPRKWFWGNPDKFKERYGHLGSIVWSRTHSYHMLIINGHPVLRIWTHWPNKARVELVPSLTGVILSRTHAEFTPKESKWFCGYATVTEPAEIELLMHEVKKIYGL